MTRITQDFINNVRYLHEEINVYENDFLNEESQYYDKEASYLVEDIFATISVSMVYEGYSTNGIISFLSNSSEKEILEKYSNFNENILNENTIPEEYIIEQLEIFDIAISEGLGSLLKGALGLATRIASKPARMKVAAKLMKGQNPERTRAALQRLAQREARKGNVGGWSASSSPIGGGAKMSSSDAAKLLTKAKGGQIIQRVKDIAGKAKEVLPKLAKGALLVGTGLGSGYIGAKLGGGGTGAGGSEGIAAARTSPGDKEKWNASAALGGKAAFKYGGGTAKMKKNPEMTAADVQKIGMANLRRLSSSGDVPPASSGGGSGSGGTGGGGRGSGSGGTGGGGGGSGSGGGSPSGSRVTPVKPTDGAERRNPTSAELAAAQKARRDALEAGKSREEAENAAVKAGIERGIKLMGGPDSSGQIDIKSVEADIQAEQERQRRRLEQNTNKSQTTTTKESYDSYDIILEYLISKGHAEDLNEANYIMLEMDSDSIANIIEEYNDFLLSEEISDWVDNLLNEGYDLSNYTWDEIVEYYVTESNYGTAKGRKKTC